MYKYTSINHKNLVLTVTSCQNNTMYFLIFAILVQLAQCGIISHDHGSATSYQNIHIEHFHPVPTYIKKEHSHLLEHPVSLGSSSSKVEINHGGKHDYGYALAHSENNVHGLEQHGLTDVGHDVQEQVQVAQYQEEESPYQAHLGQVEEQYQVDGYEGQVQYENHEEQ